MKCKSNIFEGGKYMVIDKDKYISAMRHIATSKDYPEDYNKGIYETICFKCENRFNGHKHRHICKECNDSKETN